MPYLEFYIIPGKKSSPYSKFKKSNITSSLG